MKVKISYTMDIDAEDFEYLTNNSLYDIQTCIEDEFGYNLSDANADVIFDDDATIDDKIEDIKSDYHNDDKGYTSIDVWFFGGETGTVAAKVYDNGTVEWVDQDCVNSTKVNEEIKMVLDSLKTK